MKLNLLSTLAVLGLSNAMYSQPVDMQKLLNCNLQHVDVANLCDINHELEIYKARLSDDSNYPALPTLEAWLTPQDNYPDIHPFHQHIVDTLKSLAVESVCEFGAGCGKVSKYIYAALPNINITCVEHNSTHIKQIFENFDRHPWIIKPNLRVNAKVLQKSLPFLEDLPSNAFEAVFTCTVFMHLPFVAAIQAACELVRITNRYIIHVENKNDGAEWYNMTVVLPDGMSPINKLGIDYRKLYESLGIKTLQYIEIQDPFSPATCILYLGEKVSDGN